MWDPNYDDFVAPLVWGFAAVLVVAIAVLVAVSWALVAAWRLMRHRPLPDRGPLFVSIAVITTVGLPFRAWGQGWSETGVGTLGVVTLIGWLAFAAATRSRRRRPQSATNP